MTRADYENYVKEMRRDATAAAEFIESLYGETEKTLSNCSIEEVYPKEEDGSRIITLSFKATGEGIAGRWGMLDKIIRKVKVKNGEVIEMTSPELEE